MTIRAKIWGGDIRPTEALWVLRRTLGMEFALDEDTEYAVRKNRFGENAVYVGDEVFDDRGDLFVAIRNMAANIVPNTSFRSADYIYKD